MRSKSLFRACPSSISRNAKGLARQKLCVGQAQQLFLFGVQVQILIDAFHDGGLQAGDLVNFVQKIVQLAVDGSQED
jgi:hypothetical protein